LLIKIELKKKEEGCVFVHFFVKKEVQNSVERVYTLIGKILGRWNERRVRQEEVRAKKKTN